jgi:hypothetical protein
MVADAILENLVKDWMNISKGCADDGKYEASEAWDRAAQELSKHIEIKVKIKSGGHKWEGEMCACKHSENVHNKGSGMCLAANCDCMQFTSTGQEINS